MCVCVCVECKPPSVADHLDEMWPLVALELLASFVCIERFPVNFYSSVFAIHFTDRLLGTALLTASAVELRSLQSSDFSFVLHFPHTLDVSEYLWWSTFDVVFQSHRSRARTLSVARGTTYGR